MEQNAIINNTCFYYDLRVLLAVLLLTGVLDMHFSSRNGLCCCHISWYHFSFHVEQNHHCKTHFSKPIEKRSNTDSDLLYVCLDCWTHPAGLTSLETGEICRFAKQNSNYILLHVHMEGWFYSLTILKLELLQSESL